MTFAEGLPNEQLLGVREDKDFGPLELWRWSLDSPPFADWRGRPQLSDGCSTRFSIPTDIEKPGAVFELIDDATRLGYRRIVDQASAVRLKIAKSQLEHAEDWALQLDVPAPTLEAFAASLRITQMNLTPSDANSCFKIWLNETTTEAFAGHSIVAIFDSTGALTQAGMA